MSTSICLFGAGLPCWRAYAVMAIRASCAVTARYAHIFQSTRLAVSFTSVTTVGCCMVRALSVDGWSCFHSRKVSRAAHAPGPARAQVGEVAHG